MIKPLGEGGHQLSWKLPSGATLTMNFHDLGPYYKEAFTFLKALDSAGTYLCQPDVLKRALPTG